MSTVTKTLDTDKTFITNIELKHSIPKHEILKSIAFTFI